MYCRVPRSVAVAVVAALLLVGIGFAGFADWYYAVRFICESFLESVVPERVLYYPGAPGELTMMDRHDVSTSINTMNPLNLPVQIQYRFAYHSELVGPVSCWQWTSERIEPYHTFNIPNSAIVDEYESDWLGGGRWGGERLEGFVLIRATIPFLQVAAVYIERDDRFLFVDAEVGFLHDFPMPGFEGPAMEWPYISGQLIELAGAGGIGSSIDVEYIEPFEM